MNRNKPELFANTALIENESTPSDQSESRILCCCIKQNIGEYFIPILFTINISSQTICHHYVPLCTIGYPCFIPSRKYHGTMTADVEEASFSDTVECKLIGLGKYLQSINQSNTI